MENKQLFNLQIVLELEPGAEGNLIERVPEIRAALDAQGIRFISMNTSLISLEKSEEYEEPDRDYNDLNSPYEIPNACSYQDLQALVPSSPTNIDDDVPFESLSNGGSTDTGYRL